MEEEASPSLRQVPVDLSEIDIIASTRGDEMDPPMVGYVDTQTGEVHSVYTAALSCAEEDGDPDALEDEERDTLDVAIAVAGDAAGRFEQIEEWESREEYRLMERFADAAQTPKLRDELFRALEGPKPFRRFKDALMFWPEAREAWFAFEEREHREAIRRWLNSLGIDPIDTSPHPLKPVPERW